MNNLQAIALTNLDLCPGRAWRDLAVVLHGDTIALQSERLDDLAQERRRRKLRKGAALAV